VAFPQKRLESHWRGLKKANLNDPITLYLRTDFVALRCGTTVADALLQTRERAPAGRIVYFYVVDEENRLRGVVPTRRLLLSPPERPVDEIMVTRPVAVPQTATVLDACEFFTLHRFLAFPVVDDEQRLLGIVDVELYTDELADLGRGVGDDLFQLIGVHLAQARQTSPWIAFRNRLPWLSCNLAGGLVAAFLSSLFEAELQKVVALALFIPVVLALAESVSIQSVSLALQVLRGQPPSWKTSFRRLASESTTGMLLGFATALVVGIVAIVWLGDWHVVVCALVGITGGVTCAAVIGVAVPNLLALMHREPQVAAGPVALAAADMLTLLIYFSTARWLLG
jgi:magnesium transporter